MSKPVDLCKGVGESSSLPRNVSDVKYRDKRSEVFECLVESGNYEVIGNPDFKDLFDAHFDRLPSRYAFDIVDAKDVLLHMKVLALAKDPKNRPAFEIRLYEGVDESVPPSATDSTLDLDPSAKLEDLTLGVRTIDKGKAIDERASISKRQSSPSYEVVFSSLDRMKLLSQLSSLLSGIGLDIREAHVFSTTDGYALDVFAVEGWHDEGTEDLCQAVEYAIARTEVFSREAHSPVAEINLNFLKIEAKLDPELSYADVYRGKYYNKDVVIKFLRAENMASKTVENFLQEISIMRFVQHRNIVPFIGAIAEVPPLRIVTEYMPGGTLYAYLQKHHEVLKLSQRLKFAIDAAKGMKYLHENNIVHRDLKTLNMLLDSDNVVKISDFGIARYMNKEGPLTGETGTYKWMAPEIMENKKYDERVDIYSFGIVLWELITAQVPYKSFSPIQAAVAVTKGMRPIIPDTAPPRLALLMIRCWEECPEKRPVVTDILDELEEIRRDVLTTE